jgi:hypothetical protein
MNERIRKLHKQVMEWNDSPDCSYNAEFCIPEEYTRKFAELIVRECANIDFRAKIGLSVATDYEVSRAIREHFGVEE